LFRTGTTIVSELTPFGKVSVPEKAIAEYRSAIGLKPNYADPCLGIGEILESQGKVDEAIVAYRSAARLQADSAYAHLCIARALLMNPDRAAPEKSEALAHARQATTLNPSDASACAALALAEYRAGHWTESVAAADQSVALAKQVDAANGFVLAMALRRQGSKARSRSWFDQAVAWTRKNDPKKADLLALWREAANLLGEPGPDATQADLPAKPFTP
jgi:tetratricopeptide (TPR) repeat protein